MVEYAPSVLRTRREQMYFPLTEREIDRLRRFGEAKHFAAGEYLVRAGDTGLAWPYCCPDARSSPAATVWAMTRKRLWRRRSGH